VGSQARSLIGGFGVLQLLVYSVGCHCIIKRTGQESDVGTGSAWQALQVVYELWDLGL
jgi:hypothetical protein